MGTRTSVTTDATGVSSIDNAISALAAAADEETRRAVASACLRRFPPDELCPRLKDESERYQRIDPHTSLALAEALLTVSNAGGIPYYHALGLLAKGDVIGMLGNSEASIEILDQAGGEFLDCGDEVGWARTRLFWLIASHRVGRGTEALAVVDHARDVLVRRKEWLRVAGLDLNTAYVCQESGRYKQALELYDRAQAVYESLGATATARVGWTKQNKANLLTLLGDFAAALRLHEEARAVFVERGDTVAVLRQDENIGSVYAGLGYTTRALQHFSDAYSALDAADLDVDAAWVALKMADCYLSLNRYAEAAEVALEAADRFHRHGTVTEAAKAHSVAAVAFARGGDTTRALSLLDDAADTFVSAGMATQVGHVALQRAALYVRASRWDEALGEAKRAGSLFEEQGLALPLAQTDLVAARAALGAGNPDLAAEFASSALITAADRDAPWLAQEAHYLLGTVARARGDARSALGSYNRGVDSIERMQQVLAIELRTHFLDDKAHVFQDAIEASLHLGETTAALSYLERSKSRALADYLATHLDVRLRARAADSGESLTALKHLREEHNWFYNRLFASRFVGRASEVPTPAEEAELRAALRDRERRISRLVEQLALDRTEGLGPQSCASVDAGTLASLGAGTAILEYYLGERASVAFVISASGVEAVPLATNAEQVRRLVHHWSVNLDATAHTLSAGQPLDRLADGARRILGALHRALIAPVASMLVEHREIVVVPYGPAHVVPFCALFDGRAHLAESIEVSVVPSLEVLRVCRERATCRSGQPLTALVVGHSDGGRLRSVISEARTVASLVGGECLLEDRATRDAAVAAAPRHRIVHLAAHGEARLDNPTFAHVMLADGQLSVLDVFNLELDGAMVTLSACETGQSVVTGGDELVGLSRGFLYAGASTLVQSLWRVEDSATAQFMERFYAELRGGSTKGAALRAAQLAVLESCGAHPYFWGAFQLIGDSGPLI